MVNAVSKLLKYIDINGLKAGDKILPERVLALQLGLSRASLREAITSLNISGMIETKRGAGSYVTAANLGGSNSLAKDIKPEFADFRDNPQYCFDVLDIRSALEGNAAFDAAINATPEEISCIEEAYNKLILSSSQNNPVLESKYDAEFHLSVVSASHNKVLYFIYQQLFDILLSSIGNYHNNRYPENCNDNINDDHTTILNAIKDNDPETAREAAMKHTQAILQSLKQSYEA